MKNVAELQLYTPLKKQTELLDALKKAVGRRSVDTKLIAQERIKSKVYRFRFEQQGQSRSLIAKRLESLEAALRARGVVVFRSGDYDGWDLHIHSGLLGSIRTCMAVEDHGGGRKLFRFRMWLRVELWALSLITLLVVLAGLAALDQALLASAILGSATFALGIIAFGGCGYAAASYVRVL